MELDALTVQAKELLGKANVEFDSLASQRMNPIACIGALLRDFSQ